MGIWNALFGNRTTRNQPLVIKDNESAFKYSSRFMDCTLETDAILPGIVHRVEDGGLEIPYTTTIDANVPKLAEGDFVAFMDLEYHPNLPIVCGLIGFVVGKLEPILDLELGWKSFKG